MSFVFLTGPILLLKFFLKEKFKFNFFDKRNVFLILAFCMPLIWPFLDNDFLHLRWVNFLQHMIGGGVAVGFVGLYLLSFYKNSFGNIYEFSNIEKFFLEIIFIFMLVSAFGCLNELLEFYLDLLGIGIFSADRYDTWFDIVANTSGAMSIYLIYKFFVGIKKLIR
jgi:hypothetical protein